MIRNYGLLAGALNIGLYLSAYLINKEWFFHPVLPWLGWIVLVVVMYRACRSEKAERANYPLRAALRTAFGVSALAIVLFQLFYQLHLYLFDPSLIALQADFINRTAEQVGQLLGLDLQEVRVRPEDLAFSLGKASLHLARSLVGAFVVAFVLALLLKTPRPAAEK